MYTCKRSAPVHPRTRPVGVDRTDTADGLAANRLPSDMGHLLIRNIPDDPAQLHVDKKDDWDAVPGDAQYVLLISCARRCIASSTSNGPV